ncbi:MAG: hypothetical protein A2018_07995 [Alphaproteobacteria bacterium GWF2_58_20]|nr:MAG: hypothetical protein A2018_07995 [Alphaproteobacteria bacterium GWF2_58_20]
MKHRSLVYSIVPLAALFLSGCELPPPVVIPQNPVESRLADAAGRAADALQKLAAVEQVRSGVVAEAPVSNVPPELMQQVSLTWVGPIEPVVRRMAERIGYGFDVLGVAPPVSVVVDVNAVRRPAIQVFRDIGLQAGTRADLTIDAQNHVVELQYAPVSGSDR